MVSGLGEWAGMAGVSDTAGGEVGLIVGSCLGDACPILKGFLAMTSVALEELETGPKVLSLDNPRSCKVSCISIARHAAVGRIGSEAY